MTDNKTEQKKTGYCWNYKKMLQVKIRDDEPHWIGFIAQTDGDFSLDDFIKMINNSRAILDYIEDNIEEALEKIDVTKWIDDDNIISIGWDVDEVPNMGGNQ